MKGYGYYFESELSDHTPEWEKEVLESTTIFLGNEKVEEVVIKGKDLSGDSWTRSASDYNAPVMEIFREGSIRHILVHWGPVTELYAINTETKTVSLVALKAGLLDLVRALVGKCQ